MMKMSPRLKNIVDMLKPHELLADIGCDHGYVSIEAVKKGKVKRAYAMDVAEGPLRAAAENVALAGLSDKIMVVLSDGFSALDPLKKLDCASITGMGGRLIVRILSDAREKGFKLDNIDQLILGPQSDADLVRRFVADELSLNILRERCLCDLGKYYMLMDITGQDASCGKDAVSFGGNVYTDADYALGKYIDPEGFRDYIDYLKRLKSKAEYAAAEAGKGSGRDGGEKAYRLNHKLELICRRLEEAESIEIPS